MKQLLLVFLGGGIGSCLRYLIGKYTSQNFNSFILGTFTANILGCLIIGIVLGITVRGNYINQNYALLLTAGFCGGFTTFSTFSAENYNLLKSGDLFQLALYTVASLVLGIAAVALGYWLSKL